MIPFYLWLIIIRRLFVLLEPVTPTDKALVENIINVVYTEIFAPLRNELPEGLDALNTEVRKYLSIANSKNFQGRDYSRLNLYEEFEEKKLLAL